MYVYTTSFRYACVQPCKTCLICALCVCVYECIYACTCVRVCMHAYVCACVRISASPCTHEPRINRNLLLVKMKREESTQNTTVTKSAAYASYKIKAAY